MNRTFDRFGSTVKNGPRALHKNLATPLILKIIESNPGLHQSELARKLSVHQSSVQYLERTERFRELVTKRRIGNRTHYWLKSVGKIDVIHKMQAVLHNENKRNVVMTVFHRPGITRSEIAFKLNLTLSTVSRHVKNLIQLGILKTPCSQRRKLDLNPIVRTNIAFERYRKRPDYSEPSI